MRLLNDVLHRLFLVLGGTLFAVFIAVIFYQVVARNYLKVSAVWTDEVALVCFVWSVFLGAAVALRKRVHYVVEILPQRFVTANNALRLFASVLMLAFVYVLVVHGWTYTTMGMRRFSVSTGIPLAYVFAAIPVSGIAMVSFSIENIIEDIRAVASGRRHGPEVEAAET
jgi:TRAP-type C4-dicarboxylate transport system permease small subunit